MAEESGFSMSSILNGPWVSLAMFILIAFLFAMTIWNCVYLNKVRNYKPAATETKPISTREANTLLVINAIMAVILAFIGIFFLWKIFLDEKIKTTFVNVGEGAAFWGKAAAGAAKEKFGELKDRFSRTSATTGEDVVFDQNGTPIRIDPELLYRIRRGVYNTDQGGDGKRFNCMEDKPGLIERLFRKRAEAAAAATSRTGATRVRPDAGVGGAGLDVELASMP